MNTLFQGFVDRVREKKEKGFTFLEVMVVGAMLAGVMAAVTLGVRACNRATAEMERKAVVTQMASNMMDRLFQIRFGDGTGAPPSDAQLTELFDDDDDLGTATLTTLRLPPGEPGYQFTLSGFPYAGIWEIRVGADLNLDGEELDGFEGREDLMRLDIYYQGVLVLSSMRTMEVG